jgi:predicted nucleotidyltransferase
MTEAQPTGTAYPDIVEGRPSQIAGLCRRFGVRRLDLFGSAATGRFAPQRSDLDFLVEFEDMPPVPYADAYFGLIEALETLFSRRIGLLTEPALKNPYLRLRIETEKRTLFPTPWWQAKRRPISRMPMGLGIGKRRA